jgi:hypothetical protein
MMEAASEQVRPEFLTFEGKLRLVTHGPDYKRRERAVRRVCIEVRPKHQPTAHLTFREPRCRNTDSFAGNLEVGSNYFYTVENADGSILYDTRLAVPCDTSSWVPSKKDLDDELRRVLMMAHSNWREAVARAAGEGVRDRVEDNKADK